MQSAAVKKEIYVQQSATTLKGVRSNTDHLVTIHCSFENTSSLLATRYTPPTQTPSAAQCAPPHCKDYSGTAWGTWQRAQGVDLGWIPIRGGPILQLTGIKWSAASALVPDTTGHPQSSCVHASAGQSQVWCSVGPQWIRLVPAHAVDALTVESR